MLKKCIIQFVLFSFLFIASAFATPDGTIVDGDLRITGTPGQSGLVFPDGSMQYKAATQGPTGANGMNSLILLTDEGPGSNCTNGGVKLQVGIDLNSNGTLDTNEITQTKYVCNGSASGAAGSVTGTVTYTGSQGTVNSSRPVLVLINPFPNAFDIFTENGTSWQSAILTISPGTFTFTNVPAGQYHLVAILAHPDGYGGAIVSIGDPVKIYTPGSAAGSNNNADPATAFSVVSGQKYSLSPNINFNDSMLVGQ